MRRTGPALALAAALLLVGCPSGDPDPAASVTRQDRWLSAVDGLCGALTSAQEPEASRAAFFDRSHDALHEIASELQQVDAALAARLLEAKSRVERDYADGAPSSRIEADLIGLIGATVEGLSALGVSSPGCA